MPGGDSEWDLYEGHRRRVTDELLSASACSGGRLCILGAGNCNDVDLERVAATFSEIHLVDIDGAALARAAARQLPSVRSRLHRHAPVELSGLNKRLKKWKSAPPTPAGLEASAAATLRSVVGALPGPFDVVVSACVLTQMSFKVRDELGDGHPMLGPIRLSLMATHLGTLVDLTAVGGASLFVCDLVSSTFHSMAEITGKSDLYQVMREVVASGAFYHAANPALIHDLLLQRHHERIAEPELCEPWLWNGSHGRTYLVYGMRIFRRS
jgi:hypothetical protein